MTVGQFNHLSAQFHNSPQARWQAVLHDFREARLQAALQEVLARLTGKSNRLLSFEEVTRPLRLAGRAERGVQEIPVQAIVGSVGRYADFTRTFLPRQDSDEERWARVKSAFSSLNPVSLPPIDVYKVGEVYFVLDGNHRVSVARQQGWTHIEAHVIEVPTRVPLTPDLQPDDLILKAEYAGFLEETGLAEVSTPFDLSLTVPGGYEKLKEHILAYGCACEQESQTALPDPEAARREREACASPSAPRRGRSRACGDCPPTRQPALAGRPGGRQAAGYGRGAPAARGWYAEVYQPTVMAIRERGLLRWFPDRTEADLYVWVVEHRQALEKELGWAIRPEAAVTDLKVKERARAGAQEAAPGSWRKSRLADRYADRLFADILVPLDGSPECWQALEQALTIARREEARLYGLHVAVSEAQRAGVEARQVRERFNQRCQAAGVAGNLVIEVGEVTRKICERALLTDLVVLSAAHPPKAGLPSLGSGLRRLIWNCARPLLAVPGAATPLNRALLAYDGSPKSREALFVATYLAEKWKTSLIVLALLDGPRVAPSVLDYARAYLEWHETPAEFMAVNGSVEIFLTTAETRQVDLVLMGGYSVSALEEVMGRSAVNFMLREARCPLFICR